MKKSPHKLKSIHRSKFRLSWTFLLTALILVSLATVSIYSKITSLPLIAGVNGGMDTLSGRSEGANTAVIRNTVVKSGTVTNLDADYEKMQERAAINARKQAQSARDAGNEKEAQAIEKVAVTVTKPDQTPAELKEKCLADGATFEDNTCKYPAPESAGQQQPATSNPDSCEGGNGVKLTPGKYAATGYVWKGPKRNSAPDSSKRECILIDEQCNHGEIVACDEQYLRDPSSVILPVNAGKEYYAGTSTNVPAPNANCYDGTGVIHVTGDSSGGDRCFNGDFFSETEFDTLMGATCDQDTQKYNLDSNKCETKPAPSVSGIQQDPPIDKTKAKQQCEAANNKDTNKANDKAYNSQDGTCNLVSAPVPTCKAGWNSTNTGYTECEGGKIHYLVCDKSTSNIVNGSCVSNAYPNADKECGA